MKIQYNIIRIANKGDNPVARAAPETPQPNE